MTISPPRADAKSGGERAVSQFNAASPERNVGNEGQGFKDCPDTTHERVCETEYAYSIPTRLLGSADDESAQRGHDDPARQGKDQQCAGYKSETSGDQ